VQLSRWTLHECRKTQIESYYTGDSQHFALPVHPSKASRRPILPNFEKRHHWFYAFATRTAFLACIWRRKLTKDEDDDLQELIFWNERLRVNII
jgi:hypothetical protein